MLEERGLLIIKLGGAAITDKRKLETPKLEQLQKVAAEIARCRERREWDVALVHGAGSFGHQWVKEYRLQERLREGQRGAEVAEGVSRTRGSLLRLNHLVISALHERGVPAVLLSPFSDWRTDAGQVVSHNAEALLHTLKHGLVPLLHGDLVPDLSLGFAVLSGDRIVSQLAAALCHAYSCLRVVFLSDVDGVYASPPHYPAARLLTEINVAIHSPSLDHARSAEDRDDGPKSDGSVDVTGGMAFKTKCAAAIARETGVPVSIGGIAKFTAEAVLPTTLQSVRDREPAAFVFGTTIHDGTLLFPRGQSESPSSHPKRRSRHEGAAECSNSRAAAPKTEVGAAVITAADAVALLNKCGPHPTTPPFEYPHAWAAIREEHVSLLEAISLAKFKRTPEQTTARLMGLDQWLRSELPVAVASREPRHLTLDELDRLLDWKHHRGVFRPNQAKVLGNSAETVLGATAAAAQWPDMSGALAHLTKNLKGVGPATASLILSVLRPDECVFLSDELQQFFGLVPLAYTLAQCIKANALAIRTAKQLSALGPDRWDLPMIERVLYIVQKINLS